MAVISFAHRLKKAVGGAVSDGTASFLPISAPAQSCATTEANREPGADDDVDVVYNDNDFIDEDESPEGEPF